MATYKINCIHCQTLLERDANFCPMCGSASPFGYCCPECLRRIKKEEMCCSGCGKMLHIACPYCNKQTFVQDKCENCGKTLMVLCSNKRCEKMQFFQNTKCTVCGKKIKNTLQKG